MKKIPLVVLISVFSFNIQAYSENYNYKDWGSDPFLYQDTRNEVLETIINNSKDFGLTDIEKKSLESLNNLNINYTNGKRRYQKYIDEIKGIKVGDLDISELIKSRSIFKEQIDFINNNLRHAYNAIEKIDKHAELGVDYQNSFSSLLKQTGYNSKLSPKDKNSDKVHQAIESSINKVIDDNKKNSVYAKNTYDIFLESVEELNDALNFASHSGKAMIKTLSGPLALADKLAKIPETVNKGKAILSLKDTLKSFYKGITEAFDDNYNNDLDRAAKISNAVSLFLTEIEGFSDSLGLGSKINDVINNNAKFITLSGLKSSGDSEIDHYIDIARKQLLQDSIDAALDSIIIIAKSFGAEDYAASTKDLWTMFSPNSRDVKTAKYNLAASKRTHDAVYKSYTNMLFGANKLLNEAETIVIGRSINNMMPITASLKILSSETKEGLADNFLFGPKDVCYVNKSNCESNSDIKPIIVSKEQIIFKKPIVEQKHDPEYPSTGNSSQTNNTINNDTGRNHGTENSHVSQNNNTNHSNTGSNNHSDSNIGSSQSSGNTVGTSGGTSSTAPTQAELRARALKGIDEKLATKDQDIRTLQLTIHEKYRIPYINARNAVQKAMADNNITDEIIEKAKAANKLLEGYRGHFAKYYILRQQREEYALNKLLYDGVNDGDYTASEAELRQDDSSYKSGYQQFKAAFNNATFEQEKNNDNTYKKNKFIIADLIAKKNSTPPTEIDPIPLFGSGYKYMNLEHYTHSMDNSNIGTYTFDCSYCQDWNDHEHETTDDQLRKGYAEYIGTIVGDRYRNGEHQLTAAYIGDLQLKANFERHPSGSYFQDSSLAMSFSIQNRETSQPVVKYESANFSSTDLRRNSDEIVLTSFIKAGKNEKVTFLIPTHRANRATLTYKDGVTRLTSILGIFYGHNGEEFSGSLNIADIEPGYDMYGGIMGKRVDRTAPSKPKIISDYDYADLGSWGGINLHNDLNSTFQTERYLAQDKINGTLLDNLPKAGTANYHGSSQIQTVINQKVSNKYSSDFDMNVDFARQTVNPSLSNFSSNTGVSSSGTYDFGEISIESFNGIAGFKGNSTTSNGNPSKIIGTFSGPNAEQTSGMFEVNQVNGDTQLQGTFYGNKQ